MKQNTKGAPCSCKRGIERDNCPACEGTGFRIDFAAIRAAKSSIATAQRGSYRTADGKAQIEWELAPKENGPEFSASGEYAGGSGQCIDEIARAYPSDDMVQRIAKVWRAYHLNGMNAGTPEQERALVAEKAKAVELALAMPNPERFFWSFERREINPHTLGRVAGLPQSDYYSWAVHVLKLRGLYEVKLPAGAQCTGGFPAEVLSGQRGYRYGERWLYMPIPEDVLAEIASWQEVPAPVESLHESLAKDFLAKHGLKFRSTLSDSKTAPWEDGNAYRPHFRVTISKPGKRLVFDFWGSIDDGKQPSPTATPYSVLACISGDAYCPDSFADFCAEYGYDEDSRKALQQFKRCDRFAKRLRAFFTEVELSDLQDIR